MAQVLPPLPAPTIRNASFEGIPQYDARVKDWEWCSPTCTPDILPGVWGVNTPANDGRTYVGLITRQDNTWEAIFQRLDTTFQRDVCYKFFIDLCLSPHYSGYNKPARLRIWGSDSPCARQQLLASSPTIDHYDWRAYEFSFIAAQNWRYIIIECFYKEPTLVPYRGNVLIDNIRPFVHCDRA